MSFKYLNFLRPNTDFVGFLGICSAAVLLVLFFVFGTWVSSHFLSVGTTTEPINADITSTTIAVFCFLGMNLHWLLVMPFLEGLRQKKYIMWAVDQQGRYSFLPLSTSPDGTSWIFVNRQYRTWTYHGQSFRFGDRRDPKLDGHTYTRASEGVLQPILVMPLDRQIQASDVTVH